MIKNNTESMCKDKAVDETFEELKTHSKKLGYLLKAMNEYEAIPKEHYSNREAILKIDKLTLYHYKSDHQLGTKSRSHDIRTPVLIIYALVNRPSILDLQQGHSAIAKMLESGLDIFLIDWGYPEASDKHLDLHYYINQQIDACVEHICDNTSLSKVNLLGVCQGGFLSLCYSSLHPQRVNSLVTLVTPVDFHTKADALSNLVRHIDIDLMVNTVGNIPGDMLSNTFLSLRPYYLQFKKYLDLIKNTEQLDDKNKQRIIHFILMERWIFDCPDQTGESFREFVKGCYQQNKLIQNRLKVGARLIDLTKLDIPVLNIYAKKDHLVPPASSKSLGRLIKKENYTEMSVDGGHISMFVTPKSIQKVFPTIADWLRINT